MSSEKSVQGLIVANGSASSSPPTASNSPPNSMSFMPDSSVPPRKRRRTINDNFDALVTEKVGNNSSKSLFHRDHESISPPRNCTTIFSSRKLAMTSSLMMTTAFDRPMIPQRTLLSVHDTCTSSNTPNREESLASCSSPDTGGRTGHSPGITADGESRSKQLQRTPMCARCRNHNIETRVKGHKRVCLYKHCDCHLCELTVVRQQVMARQVKVRRAQDEDKKFNRQSDIVTTLSIGPEAEDIIQKNTQSKCQFVVLMTTAHSDLPNVPSFFFIFMKPGDSFVARLADSCQDFTITYNRIKEAGRESTSVSSSSSMFPSNQFNNNVLIEGSNSDHNDIASLSLEKIIESMKIVTAVDSKVSSRAFLDRCNPSTPSASFLPPASMSSLTGSSTSSFPFPSTIWPTRTTSSSASTSFPVSTVYPSSDPAFYYFRWRLAEYCLFALAVKFESPEDVYQAILEAQSSMGKLLPFCQALADRGLL